MSPDPRDRRKRRKPQPRVSVVRTGPSPDDEQEIVFFRRHQDDAPKQSTPGREALDAYPTTVRVKMRAALVAVATAPPKRFSGGGYWEAMKGEMSGWFELRIDGPRRHHYRLFCLLDYDAKGREQAAAGRIRRTGQAIPDHLVRCGLRERAQPWRRVPRAKPALTRVRSGRHLRLAGP